MTPQRLLHRGTVSAAGLLLDPLVSPAEQKRRALALWEPGLRASQTPDNQLVVVFPHPRPLRCTGALGLPLVRVESHLTALPLQRHEWAALAPEPGCLIYANAGQVQATPLATLEPVSLTAWLDLSALQPIATQPVQLPAPISPDPIVLAPQDPPLAPLTALIPPDTRLKGGREALLQELRQPAPARPSSPSSSLGATLERWGQALLEQLGLLGTPSPLPAATQLSRQNADYLKKMLDLFERGEWTQALQHAIPLSKSSEGGELGSPQGPLVPRQDLVIRPQRTSGGCALPWDGLYSHFEQLYRDAVERLKAEGRFEEAAYVLAELLRDDAEAVSFLERHGKLQLAAEVAEARNLPAGLVVRQWWLAGDRNRALRIARRTQCFADAILRLEQSAQSSSAQVLRLEWAQLLAELGDYARAVSTLDGVESARSLARRWAELGMESGGLAGTQLLHRLLLWSETDEERARWLVRAEALLQEPGKEAAQLRYALLGALFPQGNESPALRSLLRRGLRASLADHGAGFVTLSNSTASAWARWAQLGTLEADLPRLTPPSRTPLWERSTPVELRVEGEDTGTLVGHGAVSLPSGRVLVALGEAGVLLVARDGRPLHRFAAPAHELVVSLEGDRALALTPRDASQRIHVLDLTTRQTKDWGELPLACWEPTCRDGLWWVARGEQLLALDVLATTPTALQSSPTPGPVLILGGEGTALSADPTAPERALWWRRDGLPPPASVPLRGTHFALTTSALYWLEAAPDLLSLWGVVEGRELSSALGELGDVPCGIVAWPTRSGALVGSAFRDPLGLTLYLSPSTTRQLRPPVFTLRLSGSQRLSLRATPAALTLCDDQGRVLVIDPTDGTLLRDLRLRV